ncbi:hypothetical protein [Blastococcus sp. Marseille-P5729]|uniref:hypothetical protein n=1 Tax=Blastococcus sp. Marseille-P5729 TaxID=2086582 RepID=UPI000D0EB009|nr:hypothetical protein [Blastococcus sp. Marseille-P5729]
MADRNDDPNPQPPDGDPDRNDDPNGRDDLSRRDELGRGDASRGAGPTRPNDGHDPTNPYSVDYDFNDPSFDPQYDPRYAAPGDPGYTERPPAGHEPPEVHYRAYGAPIIEPHQQPGELDGGGDGKPRKRSWRERIFSNQTARYLATGAPYHQQGEHPSAGRLVQAVQEFGWSISESDEEADDLLATAPFRVAGYRAGQVVRGQFDPFGSTELGGGTQWQFLAFDALEDSRIGRTIGHCFTAVPTMLKLPPLRILPARFLTGPTRGMQVFPTVDPIFDARFKLLAHNGQHELDAFTLLITEEVRSVLSAGDDREEIWTIEGQLVVSTAQPHDEQMLARHLEILGAMLRAVRAQA